MHLALLSVATKVYGVQKINFFVGDIDSQILGDLFNSLCSMLSQQLPSAEGGCRGDSLSIHLLAGLYLTGWLFIESSQLGRTSHSTQPPSREVRL